MKTIVSWKYPDSSQLTSTATKDGIRQSAGRLQIPILAALGALVAFWAPAYLALLDYFGESQSARSEALGWSLFAVGAAGLGTVLYIAWRDTRDPAWREGHGLPRR